MSGVPASRASSKRLTASSQRFWPSASTPAPTLANAPSPSFFASASSFWAPATSPALTYAARGVGLSLAQRRPRDRLAHHRRLRRTGELDQRAPEGGAGRGVVARLVGGLALQVEHGGAQVARHAGAGQRGEVGLGLGELAQLE